MAPSLILERYRYVSRLGAGGSSTVMLAEDTLLGRPVALKRMHTSDDLAGRSRLRREALVGASLSHPNLVSIFDIVTTEEGEDVIVMEYVEGETLAARLRGGKRLAVPEALTVLDGLAAALDAIHERGIVHRDIKPANVLLGADGVVKLADLGIAAVPDGTQITTGDAVLGTFRYMAPEQLEGAGATAAIDVYALAVVAYEALSGGKARHETNPLALARAIATEPPPDLRVAWSAAPAAAANVLTRGMSRDPRVRPRTAGELAARLRASFDPQPTATVAVAKAPAPPPRREPVAVTQRRRRPRGALIALLPTMLVAAAAAAIVVTSLNGSPQRAASGSGPRAAAGTTAHRSATTAGTTAHRSATTAAQKPSVPAGGAQPQPASTPPVSTSGASPVNAVESFYRLAASHQYAAAWALADPSFREQLQGYQGLQATMAEERQITFDGASVVNESPSDATVAVRTTSLRSDGTQSCSGTVNLLRGGSASPGWVLDHIAINCA